MLQSTSTQQQTKIKEIDKLVKRSAPLTRLMPTAIGYAELARGTCGT